MDKAKKKSELPKLGIGEANCQPQTSRGNRSLIYGQHMKNCRERKMEAGNGGFPQSHTDGKAAHLALEQLLCGAKHGSLSF